MEQPSMWSGLDHYGRGHLRHSPEAAGIVGKGIGARRGAMCEL
jgi:hypothetical protein